MLETLQAEFHQIPRGVLLLCRSGLGVGNWISLVFWCFLAMCLTMAKNNSNNRLEFHGSDFPSCLSPYHHFLIDGICKKKRLAGEHAEFSAPKIMDLQEERIMVTIDGRTSKKKKKKSISWCQFLTSMRSEIWCLKICTLCGCLVVYCWLEFEWTCVPCFSWRLNLRWWWDWYLTIVTTSAYDTEQTSTDDSHQIVRYDSIYNRFILPPIFQSMVKLRLNSELLEISR